MADMVKVRKLLEAVRMMAVHLNEQEISGISEVLMQATERLLREAETE